MKEIFEWNRVLFNDLPLSFLWEVLFRSTVMFIILLITLKLAGKRGVKQLSIFETVIIIALGSAAGDPMFYEDVGIVPAALVFVVIIALYRLVTFFTAKSKKFEEFIEGKTVCLISEGKFSIHRFKKESLAQDEFFSELRVKSVEHLGQIKKAFIEPSGEISVFYYEDNEVKYGLPILPDLYHEKSDTISKPGIYACAFCGNIQELSNKNACCENCHKKEWVTAIKTIRRA
ncbi:Uncharacterized membrane protein YcaP, DUF421 family [Flavobacterium flevense]|uniref:DUF421 domain-containing protein n=1 Tax=Flavobacterium flevense TaxID=983 RepID=A0A4Y4AWF6_9FLAO|nr:YetF domain-containing protein [Flavobacterium flevense]GEC71257.1 DUF421 domain-containing protein [Flavobacterium flevense]SHM05184.1 Uncharacterized membrane protein YcaP, DUF421 family [Flavobacterium flevense]